MVVQLHDVNMNSSRESLPKRFERKYYLPPAKVGLAYGLIRHVCLTDKAFPWEQINSLYFDTPDLDQHERSASGDFYKDKVRLRWYGEDKDIDEEQPVYIELKSRQGFASTKQRLKIMVSKECLTLHKLSKGIIAGSLLGDTLSGFGYFPSQKMIPVIRISYYRHRFTEMITGQHVSIDYHIRSTMIVPGYGNGARDLELPGGVIEIKGQTLELPETLKRMRILETDWTRFSKYSACIDSHDEHPGSAGWLSTSGRNMRL
jgi:hypothetical protein